MTYEIYGSTNSYYKVRVEGLASGVKVAWGINTVDLTSYVVLYVDLPIAQAPTLTITNYNNQGTVVLGPNHTGPDTASYVPRQYNVSVYNCVFLTGAVTRIEPNVRLFSYNMSGGGYNYLCTDTVLQQVRTYFDNYVPGQGVGEVTLQTDPPSQLLTFASQKLGQSFKYWIRGNQTIELYTPSGEPSNEFVRVTELPQQTYTDTYLDGWSGEYISEAAIDTTNLLLLLIRIDADPYIVSRFYMNGVRSKRYSSTYGLHDTGISITQYQQSQLPGHWTGVVYEQRNSHAAVEYKTNITILEFNNTASKILGCSIDSVWLAAGLIEDSSYKIDLPGAGVYLVYASMGLQGAYDEEYVAIKDGNSILCEVTAVDNYGWTSTPVYGMVEASSAKSLYFHGYHRYSGTCSVYMMALRLPSSCVIRTIAYSNQTCTYTLTSVANISLQPGKYIIIAETNFPSVGGESVYHEAVIGQKTIFAGANVYLTEYSPILNSIGYIHVLTTTTLYLNAKSTTNASVSGYIKALQLVDPQ